MAGNTRVWEQVKMEEVRVPQAAIDKFAEKLKRERVLVHGFAMLDAGKIAAEEYYAPYTKDTLHRMYSVGKSFTSLAIGLLQQEGKLSLDDCIYDYFKDKADEVHPWIRMLTIRQMLCMTTCHAKTTYKMYDGDWVESFFRIQPTNLPGAVFSYDTSSTHVLSALVERLSGKKMLDYLREKAFDKIGFSKEAYYLPDPFGVSQGGSGLNCTLRDLLTVAELVLNEGVYQGEQLLPKDYLKEATSFQISTLQQPSYDEQQGYGYQIWRGRHDCFYFYGIGGQLAVCLPKENFVLVTMANTMDNKNGIKDIFDAFFEEVYPYLAENENAVEHDGIEATAEEPKYFQNARNYSFGRNALGISELQLKFSTDLDENDLMGGKDTSNTKEIGVLSMNKDGREFVLSVGVNELVQGAFPWTDEECYCEGQWVMKDMFFIRCYIMGPNMANLYICLRFTENAVTVKMTKGVDDAMKKFDGVASGEL